ncbi:MAG TPA: hypothetical protein VE978_24750 [Chitinophagales bacterium]|nr:hypothetical protein [Chitinophagales bacterium]
MSTERFKKVDSSGVAQFDSIDHDQYSVTLNVVTFQPVNVA